MSAGLHVDEGLPGVPTRHEPKGINSTATVAIAAAMKMVPVGASTSPTSPRTRKTSAGTQWGGPSLGREEIVRVRGLVITPDGDGRGIKLWVAFIGDALGSEDGYDLLWVESEIFESEICAFWFANQHNCASWFDMQGRRVEMVRAEAIGDDVGGDEPRKTRRDVAEVFPSQRQRDRDKLADAARELGIIRDSSAFVSKGGGSGAATDAATATDGAGPPADPTGHFDGSANLAEVLIKQKMEKQELRDAAIKASKVPIFDDDDHSFLDEVAERKVAEARQTRERENDALAEFKRMQSEAAKSVPSADERPGYESAAPGRKQADEKRPGRPKVVRLDVKRQKAVKGKASESNDLDNGKGVENLFGCYEDDSD